MRLFVDDIARMMDLSAVKTDTDMATVEQLAARAKQYNCICAYVLPCYVEHLKGLLDDAPEVLVGAAVGFPSGAHSTAVKATEARELVAARVGELDMVMNVGMLRSGRLDYVEHDIREVIEAAAGTPVKVILETHYLDDDQMRQGAELCVKAGASFVKTGTGWTETGATLHNISLLKAAVGDAIEVKASGGVADLDTLVEMYRRGATRFGVNMAAGVKILDQCAEMPGGKVEV